MDTTTVLLLNQDCVAAHEGVEFRLNRAGKHPENPVMLPGQPHQWDSLQVSWPATVLYDASEGLFRCWYSGLDVVQTKNRFWRPGYAESRDGVHWEKPELGQVTFLDRPTNQIAVGWEHTVLSFVFANPDPAFPPSRRFGSYWTEVLPDGRLQKGLAWSPDAVTWTRAGTAYEPRERTGFQDISQLVFEPEARNAEDRVRGYGQILAERAWDGRLVRNIGLVQGAEPEHVDDAAQPVILRPEGPVDEELHFASVLKAGGVYLMLFESDRFAANPIHGDLRLAASPNGREFRRVHPQEALVGTGPKGSWEENLLVTTTAAMQEVGEEVHIYYIGCPNLYNSWPAAYAVSPERRGAMFAPSYLGLATLPRDRFAYAAGPGTITTRTLALHEGRLWLNCEGHGLRVDALDAAGRGVALGHLEQQQAGAVYRPVAWQAGHPTGEVQLRVTLPMDAKLYSLRAA